MKKLKGFTLAETLVTLSIIGVLAVLTLTTLGNKVDRNKALFKKAYSITERTVVELVNDETLYHTRPSKVNHKKTQSKQNRQAEKRPKKTKTPPLSARFRRRLSRGFFLTMNDRICYNIWV